MTQLNINLPPNIGQRDFDEWISQLTQYLRDYLGVTDWTAVAFENSWVNYNTTYNSAAYCKDGAGFVHLRGLVKDGTDNSTIFTLPVGYRPAKQELFSTISNGVIGRVNVTAAGLVTAADPSDPTWLSLDGITFYAG